MYHNKAGSVTICGVNTAGLPVLTEEEKRAHRDAHFATDIANARALGRRLVEKAQRA